MPVQRSPPPSPPPEVPLVENDEDDSDDRARRNSLKNFRRQRTMCRNNLKANLALIRNLSSENPEFPTTIGPEAMLEIVSKLSNSLLDWNEKICALIDEEAEWELESRVSEEIALEATTSISLVTVAARRVQATGAVPLIQAIASIPTPQSASDSSGSLRMNGNSTSGSSQSTQAQPTFPSGNPILTSQLTREYDMTPRKFSGDRLQYRTFIAEFEEFIGRRTEVSGLRKLIVLKKYLEGEPLTIVEALELNDANYVIAIALLEKNYSRVDSEKTRVIGELRKLPIVSKPYDYAQISKLVTVAQSHISVLAVNGVALSEISLSLLDSLEASLPPRLRQDFLDQQKAEKRFQALSRAAAPIEGEASGEQQQSAGAAAATEVEALLSFLRQRLRDMERVKPTSGTQSTIAEKSTVDNHRKSSSDPRKKLQSTVAAVSSQTGGSRTTTQPSKQAFKTKQCLFCKTQEHSSSKCSADLTVLQRSEILRKLNRCDKCFRQTHADPSTCEGPRTPCYKCKSRQHYTSMHPTTEQASSSSENSGTLATVVGSLSGRPSETLLWTVCAYLVNENKGIPLRILVDPGSSLTIANPALCSMLSSPPVAKCNLNIQTFTSQHSRQDVHIRELHLVGPHGGPEIVLVACECELAVNPSNNAPENIIDAIRKFDRRMPIADRSYLGEWSARAPMLLLGADQMYKLMTDAKPVIVTEELRGYPSRFGWIIGGPVAPNYKAAPVSRPYQLACCAATAAARLSPTTSTAETVRKLWDLEAIGVSNHPSSTTMSADEESATLQVQASLRFENNRYIVAMPKRSSISSLQNNYGLAADRLDRKLARLEKTPSRYRKYHEELMKFVDRGYATELPSSRNPIVTTNDGSYYMTHHEVITTSNGAEKWRIVFNCSSKAKGVTSLNEHLLAGPNLNPDLVTLLLNFRLHRIAVSADVTQAYMQVAVTEEDQPFFRFLWRYPGEDDVRSFQMQRLAWGATPSGFVLAAVLREHLRRSSPNAESRFAPTFYADDYLASYPDLESAITATSDLRAILSTASMQLAKWKSNSQAVLSHLISTGVQDDSIDAGSAGLFKVLGLSWSASEDRFKFFMPYLAGRVASDRPNTKREALSIVASLFDPLGWLAPFGLRGKRLIQQIWSTNIEWSQNIPADSQEELRHWVSEIETFNEYGIPRQFIPGKTGPSTYRLHIFGDASPAAYAAVAYIEQRSENESPGVSLVMCRSRVAPLEGTSLPRLELLAALIAVRLKRFLIERLRIEFEQVRLYTDSMITYFWVTSANPGSFSQFVYNRIREIQVLVRANSSPSDWYHVSGDENISDMATRGVSASDLIGKDAWWNGPSWLSLPEDAKPTSQPKSVAGDAMTSIRSELRKTIAHVTTGSPIIDTTKFRSIGFAIRVIAYVLCFLARKCRRQSDATPSEFYRAAEVKLIQSTQGEYFKQEILLTRANERMPSSSKLSSFQLFVDDQGLLRARTRLTEGNLLSYDEKNPTVLPGESHLVKLYIFETHRINAHFGVSTVLSHLRRRFWITRGRQVIKSLLQHCVICRKRQCRPAHQIEAPLPAYRLDLQTPFATAGVDYAGPFYTKYRATTTKTYIALFTCAVTRAVHLEAVPSMTAPQTGLALRRFLANYPGCRRIISDNGRSFVRAAADLKKVFNSIRDPEVRDVLQGRLIEWKFNCPRAAWHGGFFERMVGTVKSSLYKTLGKSFIGFEEFRTILVELAAVVNTRPLTHVSNDGENPTPITPAHFLKGGPQTLPLAGLAPVDQIASDESPSAADLRTGVTHRTTYFRNLAVRWFREYLLLLRSANLTKGRLQAPLAPGSVCLLRDDNAPRVKWQLVKIIEQHQGRDGNVRTYSIQLENGNTTRRAAQVLYPLEVSSGPIEEKPSDA